MTLRLMDHASFSAGSEHPNLRITTSWPLSRLKDIAFVLADAIDIFGKRGSKGSCARCLDLLKSAVIKPDRAAVRQGV